MDKFYTAEGYEEMQFDRVMYLLGTTYWADTRPPEQVRTSMRHAMCFGVFLCGSGLQVGFARVITDYATTYYLCDVVVDPEYQGRGMGKKLVEVIETHPVLDGLRGLLLTKHAHGLYEKFGYVTCGDRAMVKALNC